jgi:hypothetical protein
MSLPSLLDLTVVYFVVGFAYNSVTVIREVLLPLLLIGSLGLATA